MPSGLPLQLRDSSKLNSTTGRIVGCIPAVPTTNLNVSIGQQGPKLCVSAACRRMSLVCIDSTIDVASYLHSSCVFPCFDSPAQTHHNIATQNVETSLSLPQVVLGLTVQAVASQQGLNDVTHAISLFHVYRLLILPCWKHISPISTVQPQHNISELLPNWKVALK